MDNDTINGLFEFIGALFILRNIFILLEDKAVHGVSALSTFYFTSWGVWNLHYYPALNQMVSFWGGVAIVTTNAIWVALMVYFRYFYKEAKAK